MSIRELDIKISYADKGERILNDFLIPSIKEAVSYDRVTSFYTIDSLLAISQGIQSLYEKNGRMRLIVGIHSFPEEFVEASLQQEYLDDQIKKVRNDIITGIKLIEDSLQKERLVTVAWMIQDGLLNIKAAAVRGKGIFHPKTLILKDENGDSIAAIGSPNETGSGLGGNFEQLMVAKSWENYDAVEIQEKFFGRLWENEEENVAVFDITEETADMIKEGLGNDFIPAKDEAVGNVIEKMSIMPADFFVSGEIPALYMHQERAVIEALSRWPVRVMFSDEVGLGKTFEVAATMVYMLKYCGIKRVCILTPKSVLKQWQQELWEHFKIDAWMYDSANKEYINNNGNYHYVGMHSPIYRSAPKIVLISSQYARGTKKSGSIFEKSDTVLPDLLIIDEAHSARVSKDLNGHSKKTRMYEVVEDIATQIPHLILATATPMQKDADEYHAMLKLLGLPKIWQKTRMYQTSLRLISNNDMPDTSDAYSAAALLLKTLQTMKPSFKGLAVNEIAIVNELLNLSCNTDDNFELGTFVQKNWKDFKKVFIKMHPANLLTVRNTRKSLEAVGYKFPKRNLTEISINDSMPIQLFYNKVNNYLSDECFLIENELYPENPKSVSFVRVSYQQRVASSLFSCKKSLERRLEKVKCLKLKLDSMNPDEINEQFLIDQDVDEFDYDDFGENDDLLDEICDSVDVNSLRRAVGIESTALTALINEANKLLASCGDMKVCESVKLAYECMNNGDSVLLFSRYTDTIDALIEEFKKNSNNKVINYGIYTGKKSCIIESGIEYQCDKTGIKNALFAGKVKLMFCSDAASEGLNLQAARVLINVDVPWTPARLEQRIGRIARLGQLANEVKIYNVWYPYSIEAKMYHRIQKRLEQTNLAIGEFPEVLALNIKLAVLEDKDDDSEGLSELREIRNSYQVAALEQLWMSNSDNITISDDMRHNLIKLIENRLKCVGTIRNENIKVFLLPNGKEESYTDLPGKPESISLKSNVWKSIDFKARDIKILKDFENRDSAFTFSDGNENLIIKHNMILEYLLGKHISKNDVYKEYPIMLPNFGNMDLSFTTNVEVGRYPIMWMDDIRS